MFASREPLSLIISKTKLSCYWNNYFTVYLLEQNHASCTTTIICFNAPFPGDSRLSGYFGFPSTYFRRKPLKMISTGLVWARYLFCHPSNCQSTWLPTSGLNVSSSTIGVLREGVLVTLHWLSIASTLTVPPYRSMCDGFAAVFCHLFVAVFCHLFSMLLLTTTVSWNPQHY